MNETTQKRQGNFLTRLVRKQIFIPLAALLLLIVFNLIADPSFFAITLKENSLGDLVLTGNLITILDNASELVILAIGMTLVTAASGGQDISVGAAVAIAGSVILRVLVGLGGDGTLRAPVIVAFLAACLVAMIFGAFNGVLVAIFKIQPMVATLILYTAGRSIAAWINNNELPIVTDKTLLIDGKDGDLKGDRALKKGRKVTAYYSSKMTRSYPPQAEGFAIVFGKNNEKQGKYMHVEKVTPSENGESVRLLNSNRDIIVTVSKDVYEDYQNIKEGDRIMAWYSIMTMSLPGQTNATKVIVLP